MVVRHFTTDEVIAFIMDILGSGVESDKENMIGGGGGGGRMLMSTQAVTTVSVTVTIQKKMLREKKMLLFHTLSAGVVFKPF